MSAEMQTLVIPVRDLAAAKPLYAALLEVEPHVDEPYYVGFRVGEQEIGLDPNGHAAGLTAPVPYRHVDDIEASVRELVAAGAQVRQEAKDVGGGRLIATIADPDGNVLGLIQDTA